MSWTLLIDPISRLLDKIIPDPEARDRAKAELVKQQLDAEMEQLRLAVSLDQGQLEINKVEAQHASVFVAGWRPYIGWVSGTALAYHTILQPLLAFSIANSTGQPAQLPEFQTELMIGVLMAMLGMGGYRTFEKFKGVTK